MTHETIKFMSNFLVLFNEILLNYVLYKPDEFIQGYQQEVCRLYRDYCFLTMSIHLIVSLTSHSHILQDIMEEQITFI